MRKIIGEVVSAKMMKTAVVRVPRLKTHRLYGKRLRIFRKFSVHNEIGAKEGEMVEIKSHRPISRTKSWIIVKRLEKK